MSTIRVPFGLQGDNLFEPGQVPNGKACACVCPGCRRPLVARQKAATPHFAHAPGQDCAHALETAVHLAAKQLIAERKALRLPAVTYRNPYTRDALFITIQAADTIDLDTVHVEVSVEDMRPDLLVVAAGQSFMVEIAVTHFVDEVKREKLRNQGIPAIEIDAAKLKTAFTFEALERLLFEDVYSATWVYHPQIEERHLEAKRQYQEQLDAMALAGQREAERIQKYKDLPHAQKLERHCRKIGLTPQQLTKLTTFVPWESSFKAPRQVWQSAVLAYIVNEAEQADEDLPSFIDAQSCLTWLWTIFAVDAEVKDGDAIALWKYLKHLESLGILERQIHQSFELMLPAAKWGTL